MRVLQKGIAAAATILVVAAAVALLALGGLIVAGYKPEVVRSGSMAPLFERGTLIFVKATPSTALHWGEIITFQNPLLGGKETVTHRIVGKKMSDQGLAFVTKGDANGNKDPWLVHVHDKAGLYKFRIPVVGRLSFIVHSRNGYVALFAIPLFLLAAFALLKIWRLDDGDPESDDAQPDARPTHPESPDLPAPAQAPAPLPVQTPEQILTGQITPAIQVFVVAAPNAYDTATPIATAIAQPEITNSNTDRDG